MVNTPPRTQRTQSFYYKNIRDLYVLCCGLTTKNTENAKFLYNISVTSAFPVVRLIPRQERRVRGVLL